MEIKRYEIAKNEFGVKTLYLDSVSDDRFVVIVDRERNSGQVDEVKLKYFTDRPTAEKAFDELVEWIKK